MARDELYMVVRCMGHKSLKLRRGQTLRIGRHHTNDLVLNDGAVSRFHCSIVWDQLDDRPHVVDHDSANGVEVDGKEIDVRFPLMGDNQLGVGDFVVAVQLRGTGTTKRVEKGPGSVSDSALIEEEVGSMKLFSEKSSKLKGRFADQAELQRVLLDLEEAGRTGTLSLQDGVQRTSIMFGQGRVITAERGDLRGRDALNELLMMAGGSYTFGPEIQPTESNLDLSLKDFLAEAGESTTRMVKRNPDD